MHEKIRFLCLRWQASPTLLNPLTVLLYWCICKICIGVTFWKAICIIAGLSRDRIFMRMEGSYALFLILGFVKLKGLYDCF
ncbi:hypothetical protein CRT38_02897 [Anaplasma phagocytophilum str. CRT38]|uniref:Uncharacterized protein n=1 Tax=Anaplasma phagocytophilum str. CRT38 TaxID=1269275 RepID=S6G5R7_ANAPH|nr:hypothetical protein CRT38_02897 [Anaplasma phagocytophilum str. CRT38]KDB57254.1 hypothetical protein P030_04365 [Anaplasma phagocytophilum str. CRT35]